MANDDERYSDDFLRGILRECRVIAMAGASPKRHRDSHGVMGYLQQHGYRVIPVNPTVAGETIHDETVYATLAEVPVPFQMVDVFRKSDAVSGIVDDILAFGNRSALPALWLQLGVIDRAAAERAGEAGIAVVMNRCLRIEYARLM